jgi:hypothetical protein
MIALFFTVNWLQQQNLIPPLVVADVELFENTFQKDRTGLAKRFRISVLAVKGRKSFGSHSPFLEPSRYPTESHSSISDNKRKVPIGGFLADILFLDVFSAASNHKR